MLGNNHKEPPSTFGFLKTFKNQITWGLNVLKSSKSKTTFDSSFWQKKLLKTWAIFME